MAHIFLNDPILIRRCILYEVLGKTPVFEAWNHMCKRIGSNVINYVEYEFWYMRFVQKHYNLDYDRGLEKEAKTIFDIPIEILDRIFDYFTRRERLTIRDVSPNFRCLIDSKDLRYKKVCVFFDKKGSFIEADGIKFDYDTASLQDQKKLVCRDFFKILRSQNFKLDHFQITFPSREFLSQLQRLEEQVSVNILNVITVFAGDEIPIFSRIQKKGLQEVSLSLPNDRIISRLSEKQRVVKFCHFAEKVPQIRLTVEIFRNFPFENFLIFRKVYLDIYTFLSHDKYYEEMKNMFKVILASNELELLEVEGQCELAHMENFLIRELELNRVTRTSFTKQIPKTIESFFVEVEVKLRIQRKRNNN